ncbi:MAG: hypothetical protein IPL96_17850 [Holophagaceae bacterium]|nr:hypothetical protein [Holophagaceae bacterium]
MDPGKAQAPGKGRRRPLLVDETPIQTAEGPGGPAHGGGGQAFALQAVQLANHEVDIAFADVLRRGGGPPPTPTPETQGLFTAKAQAEASLPTEQAALAALEAELAKAREAARRTLRTASPCRRPRWTPAKDELEDAEADLEKAGLDPQASIQRLIEAHKAAEQVQAEHETPLALPFQVQAGSLVARYRSWSLLHRKVLKLAEAERAAQARGPWLLEERAAFLKRLAEREAARREAAAQAGAEAAPKADAAPKSAARKQMGRPEAEGAPAAGPHGLHGSGPRTPGTRPRSTGLGRSGGGPRPRLALHGLLGKAFWILLVLGRLPGGFRAGAPAPGR